MAFTPPQTPPFEPERLRDLHALGILDTPPEARFERLTALAAEVFQVPVCLISLVDEDRQWFKSCFGIDAKETSRDLSFCAHGLAANSDLVVPDARLDPRFRDNPLLQGTGLRFYAGAVIRSSNHLPLGMFCLIDIQPRSFSRREMKLLKRFAELVQDQLYQESPRHQGVDPDQTDTWHDSGSLQQNDQPCQNKQSHQASQSHQLKLAQPTFAVEHSDQPCAQLVGTPQFLNQLQQRLAPSTQDAMVALSFKYLERLHQAYGEAVLNQLFLQVGLRLAQLLGPKQLLARGSDGVFLMLIPAMADPQQLTTHIGELHRTLSSPITVGDHSITLTPYSGAAYCGGDCSPEETLSRAKTAMYQVRESLESSHCWFENGSNASAHQWAVIQSELAQMLNKQQAFVQYQPKIDLATGQVCGAEALVRWRHPTLGLTPPDQFIPIAEETGFIHELGAWVLRESCRFARLLQQEHRQEVPIAVNVSSLQMVSPAFVDTVRQVLSDTGLEPRLLHLELTETVFASSLERVAQNMNALRNLGIHFALDDFGTGYSSLLYLQKLPFDFLKIDRGFVAEVLTDPNRRAVVKAALAMAGSFGLKTVAEGVETEAQLDFLRQEKVDQIQGYLYSRPLLPEDFIAYLDRP